jgi:hypothetical protein
MTCPEPVIITAAMGKWRSLFLALRLVFRYWWSPKIEVVITLRPRQEHRAAMREKGDG